LLFVKIKIFLRGVVFDRDGLWEARNIWPLRGYKASAWGAIGG
jgi:hypothetical protein